MQKQRKSSKPAKPVRVPYLTGSVYDSETPKSALLMFAGLCGVGLGFLLLGITLSFDNVPLRIALNILLLGMEYLLFYYSGISRGAIAVNQGEIMYRRQETEREISPSERSRCYHPLKGYLFGLIGTAPLLLCAIVLALTAHRQAYAIGPLPSWMNAFGTRDDIGPALAVYASTPPYTLTDFVRLVVRLALMPFVNMVGSENADLLLVLERVSPLLLLLPAAAYGFGYTRGTAVRTQVHTDIAQNKKKRAKKARREQRRRQTPQRRGPEALN